ncbi:hypothetical protein [Butyrivibrio sp. AE3004]|uniref:hypothetical protein n=1 Tax=Butyrivibrio sp. AE3004 TaxID=1506994 RepID=UPI0004942008|nr:hypothetical protein [Butyrivibrio sp. AE3004]
MKSYEIFDEEKNIAIGILLYYEKEKNFIIELQDNLDEWSAPLLFTNYVNNGIFTVPREISFLWVKERIIPSGRQNISSILKNHHLQEYDEMAFLELSHGRCSQDYLFIKKTDILPDYIIRRQRHNLTECTVLDNNSILCFFADDTIRKVQIESLTHTHDINKILTNDALFNSCKVGTGGYSITFNDSIDIPSSELYKVGTKIPLSPKDFLAFVRSNLLDTTQCCELLECTRQNLSYMIKQEQLSPVKNNVKGNLFSKGDVIKNMW